MESRIGLVILGLLFPYCDSVCPQWPRFSLMVTALLVQLLFFS